MGWESSLDPTKESWPNDGEGKPRRAARKTKKHPHECRTPHRWWKTRVGRSWVCEECRRRWRIVEVRVDINGRDYPIWSRENV